MGLINPMDLQISFLVPLVAVAVNAMMFALLVKKARISPRQAYSFLNCFPCEGKIGFKYIDLHISYFAMHCELNLTIHSYIVYSTWRRVCKRTIV